MSRVFYTSDTHFDHRFVAGLRGFATPEEHDAEIIRRWNDTVREDDTVWHLGDVGMGGLSRFAEQLRSLNGTMHLITGNHDHPFPGDRDAHKVQRAWLDYFASVQAYARRRVGSYMFLLSHFPYDGDHTGDDRYTQYRLRDEGMWLAHGHIHQPTRVSPHIIHTLSPGTHQMPGQWRWYNRQIHVGLDAWDLAPVSQDDLIREMAKAELTGCPDKTSVELTEQPKSA